MSEGKVTFNERRAYKQCVLHGRCPVYGNPFKDTSRRVRFVQRVSKFARCGLVQYPVDRAFGLPEFLTILICLASSSLYTGEDVAPAASLSNPTGRYGSPEAVGKLSKWEDSNGEIIVTVCLSFAICALLQLDRSDRNDRGDARVFDNGQLSNMKLDRTPQAFKNALSDYSTSKFSAEIEASTQEHNQTTKVNSMFAKYTLRAMFRNAVRKQAYSYFGRTFDNAGVGIRNHSGLHFLRFLLIVSIVLTISKVNMKQEALNALAVKGDYPTKSTPLAGTGTNLCLGNEVLVKRSVTANMYYCALDGFQGAIPVGATADKYAFCIVAILFLIAGPFVQLIWRLLSVLSGFPSFSELSIISVDTTLSPTTNNSKGSNGLQRLLHSFNELLSLAYDPSATPLREQSYDDLYVKLDVNKEHDRNTLYGSLHAENALRDRPPATVGYNWAYTSEIIDANKIAIQDGVIVGFENNIGNLWKFQKVMQQNRMINTVDSRSWSKNPQNELKNIVGNSITKIVFYKGTQPARQINFSLMAFQRTPEGRLEHEQDYRKKMYEITSGFDTQPFDGIAFQTQSAVFKHPSGGSVDTYFPWCAVQTDKDTNLATYRARITNIIAIVCFRIFFAIAFFVCSAFGRMPWPFSSLQLPNSEVKVGGSSTAVAVNVIDLDTGVLDDRKELNFEYSVKQAKGSAYGENGYAGKLNSSPRLMLLYLGFFFSFQAIWIVASTMLHRLVVMELGYRQLMSNTDPVKIQEDVDGGKPAEYWCRFTKYGRAARKKRISDLTPSYLILAVCIVGIVVSATGKNPDWLGVSIAGIAIAMTLFYLFLNLMVFRETLSLKTRRAIYKERGLNEEIEEASREGEEDILEDDDDKDEAKNVGLLEKAKLVF